VIKDPSGAAIPRARVTLINTILKTEFKAASDAHGFYSFPVLPVGQYDLTFEATGFQTKQKTNLAVDTDATLRIDTALQVGQRSEAITVTESADAIQTQVETDLLAIQPGVTPVTTLTPASVIMAGVTGTINPSGDLNPGNVSIDGQRESSNGFMMNSIDVHEHMNGGTSAIRT
jgi:hypothetical protein